jgi:hypothetical protein
MPCCCPQVVAAIPIGLGVPYDSAKFQLDIAKSLASQTELWRQAKALRDAAPQSLPLHRFVNSSSEMNNVHQRRVNTLRYRVPGPVTAVSIIVAMIGMG